VYIWRSGGITPHIVNLDTGLRCVVGFTLQLINGRGKNIVVGEKKVT
jgi:hypothetical protein